MVLSGLLNQRRFARAVLVLVCCVPPANIRAAEAEQLAGTMPEDYLPGLKIILQDALRRSPRLLAQDFERMVQETRVIAADSSRLPQLGGSFNYGISQTATASSANSPQTRDSGFFYSFGLNQAVFHWGALKNQSDAARINLLVTHKNFALAYRELSVLLRKVYLSLIVEKARVRQARDSLSILRADIEVAKARKQAGTISSAALATEELRLREATLEVDRAGAEFAASRARFARLAGLTEFSEDDVPAELPRPNISEPLITAMAAEVLRDNARHTLEYEIADLRLREAVARQKIENTRLLPKIGANAGYSLTNTTNVNGNLAEQRAVTQQTVGIGGSWNIFDGFATRAAKREALLSRRSLEHKKSTDIDELLQTIQLLERSLKLDTEQIELADIQHANATEGQRLVTQEVALGNLPRADIERARLNTLRTSAKSMESRAAFLSRWSEFVAACGHDPALNNLPIRHVRKEK